METDNPTIRKVGELAMRFDLFDINVPLDCNGMPFAAGPPGCIDEDVWERQNEYDTAVKVHRRWVAERKNDSDVDEQHAKQVAEEQIKRKAAICNFRWALLAKLMMRYEGLSLEKQIALLLSPNRSFPKTRAEMELMLAKLKRLRSQVQALGTGEDYENAKLLARLDRQIDALQDHLARHLNRVRLLKSVALSERFKHMGRVQVEARIQEMLHGLDFTEAKRSDLQRTAMELKDLIVCGENLHVDEMLLAEAQIGMEECLERLATKREMMGCAVRAFGHLVVGNRIMNMVRREMEDKIHLLEANMRKILRECENWKENLSLDEMAHIKEELAIIIETMHIKYPDVVDQELLGQAETLVQDL
jgi:hypothetical protein